MTFEQFDKYQQELLAEVVGMRDTKGKEYAHSEDRFANFNRLAEGLGLPNITVAWVYAKKHVDSVESFIKSGKEFSEEGIRGRLVDLIVYLTLIGGMVEERNRKEALEPNLPTFVYICPDCRNGSHLKCVGGDRGCKCASCKCVNESGYEFKGPIPESVTDDDVPF